MKRYNPKEIEPKWQKIWQETSLYTTDLQNSKPKYMAMSMFNYPSGSGIHVGHAMNYTISDVKARFKRQQGYESYHPVGWDSFGLPAENYAIKAGISPQESMATIIPDYHKQYRAMGWSNDWEKEISTSVPEYYKWTQWIFAKMYEQGLAYQDSRWQWWCVKCQTVLANEQVIDGKCWRHDGADDPIVEKKEVKQWFFKITDYADELLEATDQLDWTPSVKLAQKNWIGRSEGINIDYEIVGTNKKVTCFTTTPVNFGMTFLVLAPEHEIVASVTTPEQKEAVESYVKACIKKTELERMQEGKEKTGVFTGAYALNQVTGKKVPIWVADFVLANFGTGAVQGCPAHDERDFDFAKKFDLPIIRVVEGPGGESEQVVDPATESVDQVKLNKGIKRKMVNSGQFNGLMFDEAMQATMDYFVVRGWGQRKVNYRMRDWSISRQRYWGAPIPVVNCPDCGPVVLSEEDLPVVLPELTDFKPSGDGRSALARAEDWLNTTCPKCEGPAERETDTIDTYVDSGWYMLRYLDPHNQEKIFETEVANKWMPVDFYNGADHATAHLLYARFITRFFNKLGLIEHKEPFKQMLYNGKVTAKDGAAFSKTLGNGPDPLDIIEQGYGADALRTYLMFAAPLELGARWDPQGVPGTHRFLSRLWNLTQEYLEKPEIHLSESESKQLRMTASKLARKVTDDLEGNRYNTAIAACMEALNELYVLKSRIRLGACGAWRQAIETMVMCIAPLAPHITDELWQQLGHSDSVHKDHWPVWDEADLAGDVIQVVVQINGKLRGEVSVDKDADEEVILTAAKANEKVAGYLEGKEIAREIYVPGRLVNFVVKS